MLNLIFNCQTASRVVMATCLLTATCAMHGLLCCAHRDLRPSVSIGYGHYLIPPTCSSNILTYLNWSLISHFHKTIIIDIYAFILHICSGGGNSNRCYFCPSIDISHYSLACIHVNKHAKLHESLGLSIALNDLLNKHEVQPLHETVFNTRKRSNR